MKKINHVRAALLSLGIIGSFQINAAPFVLDFEGVGDVESINNFYNGGTDSAGNAGVNYGVGFGSNALAVIDSDAGGSGGIANEPSASTVMFFLTGSAVLN